MNYPLKAVCERYHINFSSAKNVIQIYKKEGRMEKKIVRERKGKSNSGSNGDINKKNQVKNDTDNKKNFKNNGSCGNLLLMLNEDDELQLKLI